MHTTVGARGASPRHYPYLAPPSANLHASVNMLEAKKKKKKKTLLGWLQLLGRRWTGEIAQLLGADPYSQGWNQPSLRNWAGKVDEPISGKWGLICAASGGKILRVHCGGPQLGPWVCSQNLTPAPAALSHSRVHAHTRVCVPWKFTHILLMSAKATDCSGKEINAGKEIQQVQNGGWLSWHRTAQQKKKKSERELGKVCPTYHFSHGGGKHVSGRCHPRCSESIASAQQGLDAVVGDKESSSCNQAEPQPFEAH